MICEKRSKKILFAATILWLCFLKVAAQEPVDSMTISKYTETYPESEFVIYSDISALAKVYPLDTMFFGHSPAKAAIMSAVIPGLGQIYNRKYWKVPIVYLAIGISVERFITFQNQFNRYRRAYIDIKDGDPYTNFYDTLGFPSTYTHDQKIQYITRRKEQLRTWRDYTIVAMVATYALNIIEANVNAHLIDFSLDDNISFNIQPSFFVDDMNFKKIGLTLRFTF